MSKKNIAILIFLVLFILFVMLSGYFIYYFFYLKSGDKQNILVANTVDKEDQEFKKQQIEDMKESYNKQFPDLITGIINIVSDKKITIKLESGIEYLISPARPMSFFGDSGIKNGDTVEARGKIMNNNIFSLGSVTVNK